jgi:hypothetical protein
MGQTTQQIETHIEDTRADLGSNLREFEQKVKSLTDWKRHFENNPMVRMGAAVGGGVLLATMVGRRKKRRARRPSSHTGFVPHVADGEQNYKAPGAWDNLKGAIIGVAAARFKEFIGEVVPGRTDEKVKAIPPPV